MKTLKPKVYFIVSIVDTGDGFIILEDYKDYKPGSSNLYKVDKDFNTLWMAAPLDDFYRGLGIRENILTVYDGSGYAPLDPQTGAVGQWTFSRWE